MLASDNAVTALARSQRVAAGHFERDGVENLAISAPREQAYSCFSK
jgi:hypothetical protein